MPRILGNPRFGLPTSSTPEQRQLALDNTRRDLIKCRDMMRELEIPAAEFGTVVMEYRSNLYQIACEDEAKHDQARQKKIDEIVRSETGGRMPNYVTPPSHYLIGPSEIGGGMSVDVNNLDDEQLDKLHAEVLAKSAASKR